MKYIDVRFNEKEINCIKEMVGATLVRFRTDPFSSPDAFGVAGIITDRNTYELSNQIEVMDFYGGDEDVAIFHLKSCLESEIKSLFVDDRLIDIPINKVIKEIDLVNEHQKLFEIGFQTYDVWLTRGIIFRFIDNEEFSLEKSVWFSEMIHSNEGTNLLDTFTPVEEFTEEFTEGCRGECSRTIITYKDENL